MMHGYGVMGMGGWMWGWSTVPFIGMLALIAIIALAIVAFGSERRAAPVSTRAAEAARDILDQRYARGELDTDEYRERVLTLGG